MNRLLIVLCLIMPAQSAVAAADSLCANAEYKKANPTKCEDKSQKSILAPVGGGFGLSMILTAAAGGAIFASNALGGASGGGAGGGAASQNQIPTLQTYNYVGDDVGAAQLAAVMSGADYSKNYNQFNEIRLAYSLARGYTGRGTTISVLDSESWHGTAVTAVAGGPIAPDAVVEFRPIASTGNQFISYNAIGDIIRDAATTSQVINASWNVDIDARQIKSRAQIVNLTSENFVNAMSTAAKNGTIFVWAAGNNYATQSGALSALPRVVNELQGHFINVVAWDDATGALADYSNACGVTMEYCITAPGSHIRAANQTVSGTSFAAPIVSAAIAVLRDAFPYMSASEITDLLLRTARDLGAPGTDEIYGRGMLDLERATRPVGAGVIPLDSGTTAPLQTARASGIIGHKLRTSGLQFAFVDDYGRPFQTDIKNHVRVKNHGRAFEHLRTPNKTSANIGRIEFGFRQSDFLAADGFLGMDERHTISFIGVNNELPIRGMHILTHTEIGTARPRGRTDSMVTKFSSIYTATIGAGVRRGDWTFGIQIPDAIISGKMQMRVPTGRADSGEILFRNADISLTGRNAVEYTAAYKFMTVGFVDNPYGTDEVFIMAKKRFKL
ncbi:S8 family serine peptidase [bacterium]|nr:S8 family serine peptidase [bacterium]